MTSEQFAYWLQGFVELGKGAAPTPDQWKSIKEHLDTVFRKVTQSVGVKPPFEEKTAGIDWEKIARDLREPKYPQPNWSFIPPSQQPYWLDSTRTGLPPGTIIC